MTRAKVAILKTRPETVMEDYDRLLDMAEMESCLPKGHTTILKNNISWHMLFPGANTTPWQMEASIESLRKRGYEDLVCVQNKTVVTRAAKGMRLNAYEGLYKKHNLPVLHNFEPADMQWEVYQPKAEMVVLDKVFPDGIRIPNYFHGKNVVHLPTVKCHIYTTTTGAMKNAFGGLLSTNRHYCHSKIHETLVDLLAIQKEIHPGIFCISDATTCGNGPGPRTMTPVVKDYILASGDMVAIDAVGAKMMGFDPMSLTSIRLAHERGLGVGRMEEIEIVGEDISDVNFGFSVGDNAASKVGDMFWFGPLKSLQRLMFHSPLVYAFIYASFIYHDFIHYPFKGRKLVDKWLNETEWGKLFREYEAEQNQLLGLK